MSDRTAAAATLALLAAVLLLLPPFPAKSQSSAGPQAWSDSTRRVRYQPEEGDFVIVNGTKRFNRALYGTHTGFRIEAGDRPQFALYLPGIGGTLKLGVRTEDDSKWLNDFSHVEVRYRPGMMIYALRDSLLGAGILRLELLPMSDAEGLVLKAKSSSDTAPFQLVWAYGGASGRTPSRSGDLGADPRSIFFLTEENSQGNAFDVTGSSFELGFEIDEEPAALHGVTPPGSELHVGDAARRETPAALLASETDEAAPVLVGETAVKPGDSLYFAVQQASEEQVQLLSYDELPEVFARARQYRDRVAGQVELHTPDPYMNTFGATLSIAADAIWDPPTYVHGAVAWRSRYQGWRGAYAADYLGWHDRARSHFRAFNDAQVLHPDTTIVYPDLEHNFSRQKEKIGVGIFNQGYINRRIFSEPEAHHYDMNQVYIDQLMRHFLWTGDVAFLKESWPVIERHLDWENRNFDRDGNALYDAYASIWASDALQYSGGDVSYSSAYNYFENKQAARYAALVGVDAAPYRQRAQQIAQAMDSLLWLPDKGWYAEYRDRMGLQRLHTQPGLWTVYHTIDKEVPDPFQTYQLLRYVDTQIPHIPVTGKGLDGSHHTLSTTDWKPYTWSVNNVAFAEVVHTALAYWQGNRKRKAYRLFKSNVLDNMYMGSSPGNFAQLSYYDRFRGELYRDFADPIGISARALVEGLFGIKPDVLAGELQVHPGLPSSWDVASLKLPEVSVDFERQDEVDVYQIDPSFPKPLRLSFETEARSDQVDEVTVNGESVSWHNVADAVGRPQIAFAADTAEAYEVRIRWAGEAPSSVSFDSVAVVNRPFEVTAPSTRISAVKDPQDVLGEAQIGQDGLSAKVKDKVGPHTFFLKTGQGRLAWWQPVDIWVRPARELLADKEQPENQLRFSIRNNTGEAWAQRVNVIVGGDTLQRSIEAAARGTSAPISVRGEHLVPGSNRVQVQADSLSLEKTVVNWTVDRVLAWAERHLERVDISDHFNDQVTDIFEKKYYAPRPDAATLQLPLQGVGNWTNTRVQPEIDDSGLRALTEENGAFDFKGGISFATPGPGSSPNVVYTSQWNNYPDRTALPLSGRARHAYFLMVGSTNHMQSRFDNGEVIVHYANGSRQTLALRNPTTWWPIERDYYTDDYAFHSEEPAPFRVHLKTGQITRRFDGHETIGQVENRPVDLTDRAVNGGAATILDLPLDPTKELVSLELRATANDVVIGLMSVTLLRPGPQAAQP